MDLVAGRKRVPRPATGKIALVMGLGMNNLEYWRTWEEMPQKAGKRIWFKCVCFGIRYSCGDGHHG